MRTKGRDFQFHFTQIVALLDFHDDETSLAAHGDDVFRLIRQIFLQARNPLVFRSLAIISLVGLRNVSDSTQKLWRYGPFIAIFGQDGDSFFVVARNDSKYRRFIVRLETNFVTN